MTEPAATQQTTPPPDETDYIIHAAKNIPLIMHWRDAILSLILWCAYLYMIRDFYYFTLDLFYWLNDDVSIRAYPKLNVLKVLREYSIWLGIFIFAFVAWPIYNRIHFRNKKRRGFTLPVFPTDLGTLYDIAPALITEWQATREAAVHLDANGKLTQVDIASGR